MHLLVVLLLAVKLRLPGIIAWVRQPTTITGLASLVGVIAGWVEGSIPWGVAVPVLCGGLVMVAIPERPSASGATQKLLVDLLLLMDPRRRVEAITRLPGDLGALADSMTPKADAPGTIAVAAAIIVPEQVDRQSNPA